LRPVDDEVKCLLAPRSTGAPRSKRAQRRAPQEGTFRSEAKLRPVDDEVKCLLAPRSTGAPRSKRAQRRAPQEGTFRSEAICVRWTMK